MTTQELRANCPKTRDSDTLNKWIMEGTTSTDRLRRFAVAGRRVDPNQLFKNEKTI